MTVTSNILVWVRYINLADYKRGGVRVGVVQVGLRVGVGIAIAIIP